ncbi:MAG: DUF6660 family protein [Mucilaginibacter sp.]|uniref:DUF6660 family protein n=1 Tax=Mucilaginibacter sp. TaxID=1882438 RepID=UPI003264A7FE
MKAIALFFSIYMTILALMPGWDRQDNAALTNAQTTVQRNHSCNNQGSQETCSPFCTCSCCSTVRALQSTITLVYNMHQVTNTYATYCTPAIQQMSLSIWQPPQLS